MRRNARRRSFGRRFFDACLTGVSRVALAAGDVVARNPVVAGGATAFLVTLGFVASNAIWYQPQAHESVFFITRPQQVFHAPAASDELARRLTGTANTQERQSAAVPAQSVSKKQQVAAVLPDTTVDGGDLPALAPNGDKQVAILQYNLKQLGFYDGNVDGLTGPQTRKALEQWQSVQAKLAPKAAGGMNIEDAIAAGDKTAPAISAPARPAIQTVVVPQSRPQREVPVFEPAEGRNVSVREPQKTVVTQQPPQPQAKAAPQQAAPGQTISAEELVRIQAGLKAFGNDMVVVDGVPGKTTEDAIREFQKLFRLNVSGKPDPELISKMREIGLIS